MNHAEIVSALSRLIANPTSEVLYSITMHQVIQQIAYRMGEDALSLTTCDLQLLREEILAVIEHSLDCRDAIDEGIEVFRITRQL